MATLKLHDIELVRTDDQMPTTFDCNLATIRMPDGSIRYLHNLCQEHEMYRGTPEDPFAEREEDYEVDFNGHAKNGNSGIWVMGIVEHKGVWIGVCHREHFLNPPRVFNFYIGLAISEDYGKHWKYIGDVCGNVRNNQGVEPNMGGVPTLKVGNWLQFFFNDFKRDGSKYISAARCDLDECVECLKQDKLPRVLKYTRENEFNSDGMLGIGTMIVPESDTPGYDAHATAAYCAPLGKYLMTVHTHWLGKLLMYQSNDAIHWGDPIVVQEVEKGTHGLERVMQPYSTFVAISQDDSTDDMTTVGREFYIYWPVKGLRDQYGIDYMYRRKFTIEDEI